MSINRNVCQSLVKMVAGRTRFANLNLTIPLGKFANEVLSKDEMAHVGCIGGYLDDIEYLFEGYAMYLDIPMSLNLGILNVDVIERVADKAGLGKIAQDVKSLLQLKQSRASSERLVNSFGAAVDSFIENLDSDITDESLSIPMLLQFPDECTEQDIHYVVEALSFINECLFETLILPPSEPSEEEDDSPEVLEKGYNAAKQWVIQSIEDLKKPDQDYKVQLFPNRQPPTKGLSPHLN